MTLLSITEHNLILDASQKTRLLFMLHLEIEKQRLKGLILIRCPENFPKIRRKAPVLETLVSTDGFQATIYLTRDRALVVFRSL